MAARFHFAGARSVLVSLILAGLFSVACSDSESPTSPAAPRPSDRATIAGTLVAANPGPGKAAESAEPLADVTVTVARTGQSTRTDSAGRFTLDGLPSGPVTLNFQGNGVKGAATLALAAGATARVTISLTNGRSTVALDPRDTVVLQGTVDSINTTAASFVLKTTTGSALILTAPSTEFRKADAPASFGDLQPGGEVYLYGTRQSDGSVMAYKIYIDSPRPTPTATQTKTETTPTVTRTPSSVVALEGVVLSIDPGNGRFVIQAGGAPVTIQTNSATQFVKGDAPATFGDITVGGEVYLYGNRQADGSVAAFKVYIEVPNPTPTATRTKTETTPTPTRTVSQQVTLYGLVLSLDSANGRFVLQTDGGSVTIQTNTATAFIKDNAPGSFGDLVVGGGAYASGARQNDGSVLASTIYIVVPKTPTPTLTRTPTPTLTRTETTPTPTRTVSQTAILYGLVLSLDPANGRFVIQTDGGAVTIQTNTATEFVKDNAPASFGDLVVGGGVYASGTRQNDGSLLASKVVFPKTPTSTPTRSVTHTETTPTRTPTS
jgi:Carboxypeptidase regulatory-like domain/Domain of unknown function (DUF5666)